MYPNDPWGTDMIVQLNRTDNHRTSTPTATDLPLAGWTRDTARPVIAMFGYAGRVAGLESHLPAGWSIRVPRDLDDVRPGEIVLYTHACVQDVRMARAVLPRNARIVAVVSDDAPAELVAGVLTAGADTCVRGGHPAILASHLVACWRRQLADRWASVETTV